MSSEKSKKVSQSPWAHWVRGRRPSLRKSLDWANEKYDRGHVESIDEFLARGGAIQRVMAGVSADRLEWPSMVATVLGESAEDVDRGFAWADIDRSARDHIAGQDRGSLVFDTQEAN